MMATSGAPHDWPFDFFDPASFKVPERKVKFVFVCVDATKTEAQRGVEVVEEINLNHRNDGWKGVRWNYVVDREGNIVTARPLDESPIVDTTDINGKCIVIAGHGYLPFAALQLQSIVVLCRVINDAYQLERRVVTFQGLTHTWEKSHVNFDRSLSRATSLV